MSAIVTLPRDTASFIALSPYPLIVIVAGRFTDRRLISAHVPASGFHVRIAACSAVSFGNSFVSATARGSTAPTWRLSPGCLHPQNRTAFPELHLNPPRPRLSAASRHRNVGAAKSGGKIDPCSG